MGFKMRKSFRLGPLRFNVTQKGLSSVSIGFGRWSYNFRTRRHTIDTPGPGYWQSDGK
jgi:hypothetical protein